MARRRGQLGLVGKILIVLLILAFVVGRVL